MMALYTPDYKLQEATELVKSLKPTKRNELIEYYIDHQKEQIAKLEEENQKYRNFFKVLWDLLPAEHIPPMRL